MLRAYCKELKEFYNTIDGSLPENPKQYKWECPHCNEKMMHVKESYDGKMEHFRHFSDSKCINYEPESPEHLIMKNYCYQVLANGAVKKQLEYRVGDQIIDVFFELETGKKIAIECQCSVITVDKLLERTQKYTEKGFYTLWILGSFKFGIDLEDYWDSKKVKGIEKALHKLYGRVYYFDTFGYVSPYSWHIYALEFSQYRNDYYQVLKNTKTITVLDDFTSKLICVDDDRFKKAVFNLKPKPTKEIKEVKNTGTNTWEFQYEGGTINISGDSYEKAQEIFHKIKRRY